MRVVIAEEVFEADVPLANVASMQTRPARPDRPAVDLRRLVAGFLRMAPDVAIVGEVRDREALPLTADAVVRGQGVHDHPRRLGSPGPDPAALHLPARRHGERAPDERAQRAGVGVDRRRRAHRTRPRRSAGDRDPRRRGSGRRRRRPPSSRPRRSSTARPARLSWSGPDRCPPDSPPVWLAPATISGHSWGWSQPHDGDRAGFAGRTRRLLPLHRRWSIGGRGTAPGPGDRDRSAAAAPASGWPRPVSPIWIRVNSWPCPRWSGWWDSSPAMRSWHPRSRRWPSACSRRASRSPRPASAAAAGWPRPRKPGPA